MKILFLIVALLSPCLALAGALSEPILPDGVGVNIHFTTGHRQDLDMIATAGFKVVRMDLAWADVERKIGRFDWSAYDELTANLDARGIRSYYILDYSNPLYEPGGLAPQHPDSVAAYARFAAAAARHFQSHQVILEIWNEPNGSFWNPHADVQQYTAMALAACKAICKVEPHATIVAPALSGLDWSFLESFFKAGALEYLDAVSVHPYRDGQPPETAAQDYERLRAMIIRYSPNRAVPIISGEWGYSSYTHGVSLQTQANFITRQQLSNLLNGVPVSIWYDWRNDGKDPNENEHNFGTVTDELQLKPAYRSVQILTHELGGYRISRRQPMADPQDFALVLTNSIQETKLAVWTLGSPHEAGFDLPPGAAAEISVVDDTGQRSQIKVSANHFNIELSGGPQYIREK